MRRPAMAEGLCAAAPAGFTERVQAPRFPRLFTPVRKQFMRAEIETVADELKQSIVLLRRHL